MNRRFLMTAILLMLGFALADRLAVNLTIQKFHESPPVLTNGGTAFTLYHPQLFPDADLLRSVRYRGHHVRYFGVVHRLETIEGTPFTCDQVIHWYWCDDGWGLRPGTGG